MSMGSTACLLLVGWELHVWTSLPNELPEKTPQLVVSLLPSPSLSEDHTVFATVGRGVRIWQEQNTAKW